MKKRFLSALLAMAMVLTMLPVSAFAAGDEAAEDAFTVHFQADVLTIQARTGLKPGNTSANTMWIAFKDAPANAQNMWIVIETPDEETYGLAATGNGTDHNMNWSFENPWNFENWNGESGKGKTDADKKTLDEGEYTVTVYNVNEAVEYGTTAVPAGAEEVGSNTVTLAKTGDTLQEVMYAEVVAAPIVSKDATPVENLYTGTPAAVAADPDVNGVVKVAISVEALKVHNNQQNNPGLWAGFSLVVPAGADKVAVAFSKDTTLTLSAPEALEKNVDGNGAQGIAFYANKADGEDAKTHAKVQWYRDNVAISAPVTYEMDLDGVHPYVEVVAPKFVAASTAPFGGKTVADLQSGTIAIAKNATSNKYEVTGVTLKKVTENWTDFNSAVVAEQTGYYVAFAVPKTIDGKNIVSMKIPGKAADGTTVVEKEVLPTAFTETGVDGAQCDLFIHLGATKAEVLAKTYTIKVKYDGADDYTECVFDFSKVTIVEEGSDEVAPKFVAASAAPFGGKTVADLQTGTIAIAKNATSNKYEVTGVTLKKVTENWTDFNSAVVAEQTGYYVAFAVPKTIDGKNIVSMKIPGKAADGTTVVEKEVLPTAFTETGVDGAQCDLFIHLGATKAEVLAKTYTIKVKYDGADDYTECVLDFSKVTIVEDAPVTYDPKMYVGLSVDAADLAADINAAAKLTGSVETDKENLLWFVMTGFEPGDYTLSMKKTGGDEVLNDNSVAYENGSRTVIIPASGKYLLYVSLDEFSADGTSGQGNKTALGNGGKFTVTATKGQTVVKGEINLVTVTLKAEEDTGYTPVVLFAQTNSNVKIPEDVAVPENADYLFQGWTVADETYANGDELTVGTANVVLSALWLNNSVTAGDPEVKADAITDNEVKTSLDVTASADNILKDPGVVAATEEVVSTQLDTADKMNAILPEGKKTDDGYTVVVEVYLEVVANEYVAPADGEPAVLKLNVTPKYRYAVKNTQTNDVEAIPGQTGTALASKEYAVPVDVVVTLAKDKGFVAGEPGVFALHYNNSNKVDQYIPAEVKTNAGNANLVDIEFTASKFSPYAITKDGRTVNVTYKQDGVDNITAAYTPDKIGVELPEVTVANTKVFKGWYVEGDAEKTIVVAPTAATLTEEILDAMVAKADSTTHNLTLVALIEDKPQDQNTPSTGPAPGGLGGGTTTYSVSVPTVDHGTVTVNPRNAAKDATVTITVSPNQGYTLGTLTVTDKDGNNVELTKVDSNKYTFKMPASAVTIAASFVEGEAPAYGGFTDVAAGEYYADAVAWAVDKGITNGLTETTFGPNASCTRAQMVTFLWRAAGSPEPTTTTTNFTDIDSNEYYYKAVLWAVEKGITTGTTETTFSPNATVTRAQTVTFLYRYAGTPAAEGTNAFTDLEAGEYYIDAVQWAVTNSITNGTSETTFSPANNCTRGQIVTFLYRHIVK